MSNTLILEDGQKLFRVKITYLDESINEVLIRAYNKHQATIKAVHRLTDGAYETVRVDEVFLNMHEDMFFIGEE